MSKSEIQQHALDAVIAERSLQDEKWGEQNHGLPEWMVILGEEYGEACEEVLVSKYVSKDAGNFRREIIQVAAVAVAILECLERNKGGKWLL